MKVFFINNHGSGFADHVETEEGITVAAFFQEKLPDAKPQDYLIRVNRQPTPADQVLQPGDRISITPSKIEVA